MVGRSGYLIAMGLDCVIGGQNDGLDELQAGSHISNFSSG